MANTANKDGNTPLHQLLQHIEEKGKKSSLRYKIQNIVKKDFRATSRYKVLKLLLENGADISKKDGRGNNVLHYIASFKGEQKVACLELTLGKDEFSNAINATNDKGQTPLHQLLQHIKEKNEDRSCTDRKFEKTNRYKALELFLQNGADITAQDKEGNNALHCIASFKGEQKVVCLELILRKISENQLRDAANAANRKGNTPLELALKKRAKKGSIEYLSQETIFDLVANYDNTTKFCVALLQKGANYDSLWLEDPEFHTKKYYLALRDLKDYSGTPQKAQEKAKELKEQLEEKYHCGTASKKCKSVIKKTGSAIREGASATGKALSAFGKYVDPANRTRELLTITVTVTVIAIAAFAFFQGQVGIGAAIPIISVAGVICLTLTLGFSGIKKLFENSTSEAKNLINNDQQKSSDQPEHKNPPNSQMSDTHSEPHKEPHKRTV
ncbi:hypothetical protein HET73_02095 [Wolbachia endosymbiont of Atemnus politus]|uniref:ankyrin repeat domain-containing protein n=1 Tax=Wolbachia endosymbiont of Atemnus politus TaxID=2682840 RepID=UPI001574B65D|nr:ankyrin repeat domain-containing protein [Wolbachia endosymbiont of Atemnus politus]NSM56393.1 hypothetical protein [Wolbachia endosymbiont of Atemnus politus]